MGIKEMEFEIFLKQTTELCLHLNKIITTLPTGKNKKQSFLEVFCDRRRTTTEQTLKMVALRHVFQTRNWIGEKQRYINEDVEIKAG